MVNPDISRQSHSDTAVEHTLDQIRSCASAGCLPVTSAIDRQ